VTDVLCARDINRATLERQFLLRRADVAVTVTADDALFLRAVVQPAPDAQTTGLGFTVGG